MFKAAIAAGNAEALSHYPTWQVERMLESNQLIDHFTVLCLVTWPLNGSEAGGDLALIQTSQLLL